MIWFAHPPKHQTGMHSGHYQAVQRERTVRSLQRAKENDDRGKGPPLWAAALVVGFLLLSMAYFLAHLIAWIADFPPG